MDVDASYEIVTASGVVPQIPQCPTLKAVTGGGLDSTTQLFGSAPEVPGWGWYASAGPSGAFLTAYAICMTTPYPGEARNVLASRGAGTAVDVTYQPACGALDHTVYWGTSPFAGSYSWKNSACGLGTSGTGSFNPGTPAPGTFIYYVVVGKNATNEGSYGTSSSGERPEAVGIGACDAPQTLASTCPP